MTKEDWLPGIRATLETVLTEMEQTGSKAEAQAAVTMRGVLAETVLLLADNAALVAWVNEYGHAQWCPQNHNDKLDGCHEACAAHPIFTEPHPGTTLLANYRKALEVLNAIRTFPRIETVLAPRDSLGSLLKVADELCAKDGERP